MIGGKTLADFDPEEDPWATRETREAVVSIPQAKPWLHFKIKPRKKFQPNQDDLNNMLIIFRKIFKARREGDSPDWLVASKEKMKLYNQVDASIDEIKEATVKLHDKWHDFYHEGEEDVTDAMLVELIDIAVMTLSLKSKLDEMKG